MNKTTENKASKLSTAEILNLIHHMEVDEEKHAQDLAELRNELKVRESTLIHKPSPRLH